MAAINATDVSGLIKTDEAQNIISDIVTSGSQVTPLMTELPQMPTKQRTLRVSSALPTAYFVDGVSGSGDPGTKPTTSAAWDKVTLYAEELAVIVPIAQELADDIGYDIWGQVRPLLVEAFGVALDAAILVGTNAPAVWPDDIVTAATGAGNAIALGDIGDIYADLLEPGGLWSLVESDGYEVTGAVAHLSVKAIMRALRSAATDEPLLKAPATFQPTSNYQVEGVTIGFPVGVIDPTALLMAVGNFKKLVYAIRQDITYKILTEATLTDGAGNTLYNLAEQDMVALRAVLRIGWAAPNPINRTEPTEGDRYPIAVLTPAAGSGSGI